jgi:phosphonopyruvate decarboxylase
MSKASSFGLGLALARPDRKMVVLDGDGGLLMNLGSLVTIANMAPANLVHFVFENGVYRTSGGQPIPGKLKVDFAAMAKDAGFEKVYTFSNGEDFSSNVKQILHEKGPTFVYLKVAVHVEEKLPPFPTRTTADCFRHLKKALA